MTTVTHYFTLTSAMLLAFTAAGTSHAQNAEPASFEACSNIQSDSQRLACYDRAAGRATTTTRAKSAADRAANAQAISSAKASTEPQQGSQRTLGELLSSMTTPRGQDNPEAGNTDTFSLLDSRWELSPERKLGTLNIRGYKPLYIEPVFVSSKVNQTPATPNPDNVVDESLNLDKTEAKFQISFKTKLIEGIFGDYGDLWAGYTQSSRWQVFNSEESRPFRETNYEPEAMLVFGTDIPLFGWDLRLLGIGFNHQSNGRSKPLSRSWNRIIGRIGLERGDWTIMLRPWIRVSEDAERDDNPDIIDYLGHGDLQIIHVHGQQEFALMLRHNFSTNKGAGRLTWSFPIDQNIRGYAELFSGYGESLIDYNHRATYFGLGVTLLDWY